MWFLSTQKYIIFKILYCCVDGNCFVVYFNACTVHHTVFIISNYLSTRQTNTQSTVTMDCIYSHINTLLAQETVTSHGLYCITQRQSNNFNLIILRNCCFNSFNLNNLRNLAKYKFLKLPEGVETCMS